ncbi:MAG: hypothetical protein IJ289_00330 [Clostridia bacterium]|nr:hypothetical protein [Clostridia bacterium]
MKKIISVLLAVILSFSALAVAVAAEGAYQTYYMSYEVNEENIRIIPLEGYSQYVLPGEDFKFTVEATENRSDVFVLVHVDNVNLEPDIHGVYTIEDVTSDHTIKAFFSLEENQSNIFASLIIMLRQMFQMIVDMFNQLFQGSLT